MKSSLLINLETAFSDIWTTIRSYFHLSSGLAETVIVNDLLVKLLPFSAEIDNW